MEVEKAGTHEERLERWVAEQQEKHQSAKPPGKLTRRSRLRLRWAQGVQSVATRIFDRGLDTVQVSTEPEHEHPDRVPYVASDWHVLPRALRYIGVSESDTFVDFGCGRGRILHQAAKRPFRQVIGVEISPVLAEAARRALTARSHEHHCGTLEIVVADAAQFQVPDDLTVAYLFYPFYNDTFTTVLAHIIESLDRNPRRLRLIYCLPSNDDVVLGTGRFRLLTEQRSRLLDTLMSRTRIFESI